MSEFDENFPYEAREYDCDIIDHPDTTEEPDWSKVPDAKRGVVRAQWLAKATKPRRWKLFGPQIPWYMRQPKLYTVTVIGLSRGASHD